MKKKIKQQPSKLKPGLTFLNPSSFKMTSTVNGQLLIFLGKNVVMAIPEAYLRRIFEGKGAA